MLHKKIYIRIALLLIVATSFPVFADEKSDVMTKLAWAARYEEGNGIIKDELAAVKLYKEAAQTGIFIGLFSLAMKYSEGKIVPQSDRIFNALMILAKNNSESEDELIGKLQPAGQPAVRSLLAALKVDGNFLNALKSAEYEANIENQKYVGGNVLVQKSLQSAQQGDVKAQVTLGWLYKTHPDKVPTDYKKSVYWFSKAVAQGDAHAQTALGEMYDEGKGVEKDHSEALRLYRLAALQGGVSAQIYLGRMYREGRGVEKDFQQAMFWLRKASVQSLGSDAWITMGEMFEEGQSVQSNKVIAYAFYKLSTNLYPSNKPAKLNEQRLESKLNLAELATGGMLAWDIFMAKKPNGFLETLDKATVNPIILNPVLSAKVGNYYSGYFGGERYSIALKILQPLAENGDAHAQFSLGEMYESGKGLPVNKAEAISWYRKSAALGYSQAQGRLGRLYEDGDGVPQNYKEAFEWYLKSANQGDAFYLYRLADLYAKGLGVARDFQSAEEWYIKAISAQPTYWVNTARNNLADLYISDLKQPKNYAKAIELYRQAASYGESVSQLNLAKLFETGTGVTKNLILAHALAHLAENSFREDIKIKAKEARLRVARLLPPSDVSIANNVSQRFKKSLGEYFTVEPENASLFLESLDEVIQYK